MRVLYTSTGGTYIYSHGTYIIDGNKEIGMNIRSNLCYLICLRHLIRSRAVTNRIFFLQKALTLLCVRNMF